MELGLEGKKAIVCASSRGLGRGCAFALAKEGVSLVVNGLDADRIARTATEIAQQTGVAVTPVAADLDDPKGRAALLDACPDPDILINNNGGPPPGNFREWGLDEWNAGLTANFLAPTELIRATVDGMIERGFGRIINITSIAVRTPFPGLAMSSASRSALTALVASVSREVAAHNVTINNLQPGIFETDRMMTGLKGAAKATGRSVEDTRAGMLSNIPAGRFGDPDEFGHACAFLCSSHSGFITGQSFLLDGGHFPGTF